MVSTYAFCRTLHVIRTTLRREDQIEMNIHALTHAEASYLLFAVKKTLSDRAGLTPEMEQFYDSTFDALSSKLQRIARQGAGSGQTETRHSYAKVRPTWYDVAVGKVSGDPPTDNGEVGEN